MAKVLIIDDASFIRCTLKAMLERNGYEVAGEAVDGIDGILKYKQCSPDIVTMDISMPKMNGLDSLKEIIKYDPNAKIIMLSAMGQELMVKNAVINGAKTFIVKPFKEEMLMKTLTKVLSV
jgi:two-component system chemotaxis response regulator CheY